jgi:hypothetical protein
MDSVGQCSELASAIGSLFGTYAVGAHLRLRKVRADYYFRSCYLHLHALILKINAATRPTSRPHDLASPSDNTIAAALNRTTAETLARWYREKNVSPVR